MKKEIIKATDTFKELVLWYLILIATSGLLFAWFEHKKVIDGVWWSFVTAMTVGYGDFYPITIGGRIIAIVLMHIVPLVLVPLIVVRMMNDLIEDKNQFTNAEQEHMKENLREIKEILKEKL